MDVHIVFSILFLSSITAAGMNTFFFLDHTSLEILYRLLDSGNRNRKTQNVPYRYVVVGNRKKKFFSQYLIMDFCLSTKKEIVALTLLPY